MKTIPRTERRIAAPGTRPHFSPRRFGSLRKTITPDCERDIRPDANAALPAAPKQTTGSPAITKSVRRRARTTSEATCKFPLHETEVPVGQQRPQCRLDRTVRVTESSCGPGTSRSRHSWSPPRFRPASCTVSCLDTHESLRSESSENPLDQSFVCVVAHLLRHQSSRDATHGGLLRVCDESRILDGSLDAVQHPYGQRFGLGRRWFERPMTIVAPSATRSTALSVVDLAPHLLPCALPVHGLPSASPSSSSDHIQQFCLNYLVVL